MPEGSIIRVTTRESWYIASRDPMEDPRLSYKAKGLLSYCMSRPPGWQLTRSDLINRSTDGRDAVQSGVAELVEYGYAAYLRLQDAETGTIQGQRLFVREQLDAEWPPQFTEGETVWRLIDVATEKRENRPPGKPAAGKSAPNSNNSNSNESKEANSARAYTREEVSEVAEMIGCPKAVAEKYFLYYEAHGWPAIQNLKSHLAYWRANESKMKGGKPTPKRSRKPQRNYDHDTR